MTTTTIETLFSPDGLQVRLRVAGLGEAPIRYCTIALANDAKGIRTLGDAHLVVAAFGDSFGAVPPRIAEHFAETSPQSGCPACKLLGKVLTAQGRRPVTEREVRLAAIQVVPEGVTLEGLSRSAAEKAVRAARREASAPKLVGGRPGLSGKVLEDLF